jgi:hypothetical protein
LVVSLTSSDETEATVPATVTIPAGESSASVRLIAQRDNESDGTQTVLVTAAASGYVGDEASIDVTDNPFPWHNSLLAQDVNADGVVAPLDALVIINDLNSTGSRSLNSGSGAPFLDVSQDGAVTPLDVLLVINFLNDRSATGEGEAGGMATPRLPRQAIAIDTAVVQDVAAVWADNCPELLQASRSSRDAARDSAELDPAAVTTRPLLSSTAQTRQESSRSEARLNETLEAFIEDVAKRWTLD